MTTIIDEIKTALKITDLVAETFSISGKGRILTTVEHDSLKLWPAEGRWWWFSKNTGGDVIDWHRHIHSCDLPTAIDDLARKANIERRPPTPAELEQRHAAAQSTAILQIASDWYAARLPEHSPAWNYCLGRGWDQATITREHIGYNPPSHNNQLSANDLPLSTQLRTAGLLDHPLAKAVLSIPGDMLIYTHRQHGRPVYLSGRSITGKRHYNLPSDTAGDKQPYTNTPATPTRPGLLLLVEGQADAIALGQLGIPAVALCGLAATLDITPTHIALDNDIAGRAKAWDIALTLDPMLPIISWPAGAKDAAEWLKKGAPETDLALIGTPALIVAAHAAKHAQDQDRRKEIIRRVIDAYLTLDELTATDNRDRIADALGETAAQFGRLITARKKETAAEKPAAEKLEYSAGMYKAGILFEQILTVTADRPTVLFAVRQPNGAIKLQPSVDTPGCTYIPYPADMAIIDKRVVLFPSGLAEYGDVRTLIANIQAFLHRYLDIDSFYERLAAYYILLSWLYDLFETLPYLRALGDYGTGKSRFLQAIGALCYRPMFVSGASTVSPIFRLIDMFKGTLVIDEADFANSDAEAEIIKILNVGYYKGGVVLRAEKDPNSQYEDYWPSAKDVYGPKLLATRKPFGDRATESRCLTRRMTTARPRPDIPFIIGPTFWAEATALRNQLLRYRLENYRPIHVDHSLADQSVEPRLNQVTMALKAIVEDAAMRRDIDTFIRAYNEVLITDRQMSVAAIIVQALAHIHYHPKRNILGDDLRDFSMKGIADRAQEIINEIDPDTRINPKTVSRTLNEDLGLSKRTKHPQTRRDVVDFDETDLLSLMLRYGIEKPPPS